MRDVVILSEVEGPGGAHPIANLSRRRFLTITGAAATTAACAPAAPTPTTSAPNTGAAWEAEWTALIAEAKKEGKLVAHTLPGEGYRRVFDAFEAAFSGITVEHTSLFARDYAPRVLQERKAGLYQWDVAMPPTATAFGSLYPEKVFAPVKPLVFRPDVLDDKAWHGGFEYGFVDTAKQHAFGFTWNFSGALYLNSDLVKEGEVKGYKDILDPKWKGKIAVADPRTGGASAIPLTVAALRHGPDVVKQLFAEQAPVLFSEPRQGAERLVRGAVAIAIGTTEAVVNDFKAQGIRNVRLVFAEDFANLNREIIWFMDRAPHPNASKLYVNWLLSKEGQQVYTKALETNSRRTDIPVLDPSTYPPEGADKRFLDMQSEEKYLEIEKIRDMTRELLR